MSAQRPASAQPDAAQEFVMQFKKQLLPFLVQALDPKLLERGNEGALKKRIEELVDEYAFLVKNLKMKLPTPY